MATVTPKAPAGNVRADVPFLGGGFESGMAYKEPKMTKRTVEDDLHELDDPDMVSVFDILAQFHNVPSKGKMKKKNRTKMRRGMIIDLEEATWPTCVCGVDHPPLHDFDMPDRKKCTYYYQIADLFPYISISKVLTAEEKFIQADRDRSGVIELGELYGMLKNAFGDKITEQEIAKTFKQIDKDGSGTLDFVEVLTVVDKLVMRERASLKLPLIVQQQYSKVCAVQ